MDSPSQQRKTVSPSQQIKNAEVNRLRKLKGVIDDLTILGISVDEPPIIEKYDEYNPSTSNIFSP